MILLLFAILRGWRLHDLGVDRLLAVVLILIAATAAGSADLGTDAPSYHDRYDELPFSSDPVYLVGIGLCLARPAFLEPQGALRSVCLCASCAELAPDPSCTCMTKLVGNATLAFFVLFCFNLGEVAFVRQYVAASIILLVVLSAFEAGGEFILAILSIIRPPR